ncbi:MAG TPA: hypothetical protein VHN77_11495 [Phycisphaerales bacterium]|nr:hypothetical protein [Phycisphaerales bacterium]
MSDSGEHAGGELRAFLAGRDVACPNCGYSLRGLVGDHCPECNEGLKLWVSLEHPLPRSWTACVLTLAAVGGFFLLLGVVFTVMLIVEGNGPSGAVQRFMILAYPPIAAALCVPACIFLLRQRGRRWLRTRSPESRQKWVLVFIGVPVLLWLGWGIGAIASN